MTGGAPFHSSAFEMFGSYVLATTDGRISVEPKAGPPPRIAGLTIGMHHFTADSSHGGELHPTADEFLFVVSGSITVIFHCDLHHDHHRHVRIDTGRAAIVPAGIWHRIVIREPATVLHATPGPEFAVRGL